METLQERKIKYANSVGKLYEYDNFASGAVATRGYTLEYKGKKMFIDYDFIHNGMHFKTFKKFIDSMSLNFK